MTVGELITQLQQYPQDYVVHLDMDVKEERIVRSCVGTRHQRGYMAVAIDGAKRLYPHDAIETITDKIIDKVERGEITVDQLDELAHRSLILNTQPSDQEPQPQHNIWAPFKSMEEYQQHFLAPNPDDSAPEYQPDE
jgi:hypothetical protein